MNRNNYATLTRFKAINWWLPEGYRNETSAHL